MWPCYFKLAFHGAVTDTDTDTDFFADILARMSVSVSDIDAQAACDSGVRQ